MERLKINTEEKKKLLIVDDEKDILEFLSYNFRKKGYTVVTASNGIEGLGAVETFQPDLIIADIMMPQMSGIMMCRLLKAHNEHRHIPLLILSAVNDDYQVLSAMDAGADHYVSKPVRISMLADIVSEMTEEKIAK